MAENALPTPICCDCAERRFTANTVRYTVDLSPDLNKEFEGIAKRLGITKSAAFRRAFALLKVADAAVRNGEHIGIGKDGAESLKAEFILT